MRGWFCIIYTLNDAGANSLTKRVIVFPIETCLHKKNNESAAPTIVGDVYETNMFPLLSIFQRAKKIGGRISFEEYVINIDAKKHTVDLMGDMLKLYFFIEAPTKNKTQSHSILYPPFRMNRSLSKIDGKIHRKIKAIKKIILVSRLPKVFIEAIKIGENRYIPK